MRIVKRLPSSARFEYVGPFGVNVYRSATRRYRFTYFGLCPTLFLCSYSLTESLYI